jgi:hypothetical protein
MKRFGLALIGAIASSAYWWAFSILAYGLIAGDPYPGSPERSATWQYAQLGLVLLVGLTVYAVLSIVWRRIEDRILAGNSR